MTETYRGTLNIALYGLVDPARTRGRNLGDLAAQAVAGGVTILQYRDKTATTRELVENTRRIKTAITGSGVPLLVNDRADVAFAAGADGVHLGQDDLAPEDARRLLGPDAVIGQSIKRVGHANATRLDLMDYVCVGGVFATASKDNPDPPIGTAGLAEIAAAIRARKASYPVGAIAGITAENATAVIMAGADGIAVISDIFMADDVEAAARGLREIVDAALVERRA